MLEIIFVIWLWRVNGRNAILKGQKPTKYHVLTLVLWFGLEILGTMGGVIVFGSMNPNTDPLMYGYMFGILGAALGGILSYIIAKNAPQGDYHPEGRQGFNGQPPYNQNPYTQNWNNPTPYGYNGAGEDMLARPATVCIIAEPPAWRDGADDFYLNGVWMCRIAGGSQYSFVTSRKHNIVTVGSQGELAENNVKFIAAEGGYAEIHTQDGRIIPERFKNYTAPPS